MRPCAPAAWTNLVRAALAVLALLLAPAARAAQITIAVAANFAEPARQIAAAFQTATGNQAILTFGASGLFYSQIVQGAPYDVFLSADTDRTVQAERDGLAVPNTRFIYAIGQLVLYSTQSGLIDARGAVLRQPAAFEKLAIADPATAPYGAAAVETMAKLGLAATLKPKLVQGASITQTYQFVATGAAQLGFVALSQVTLIPGGSRWQVPPALHAPIAQGAVLLFHGDANPAAHAFLAFLQSPPARAIIRHYGYATP